MDGEAEVTDGGAVDQSAGDHVPAHECLRDEEHAHRKVNAKFLEGNGFLEEEVENRDGIEQACKARNDAMDPFHVKDELIFFERHACVDLLIFGCLLGIWRILPARLAGRWVE